MDNENQHFVPQFYLRNFSNSEGAILSKQKREVGTWTIDEEKYDPKALIKHEASGSYFYGKDSPLDDALTEIENKAGPAINWIIENEQIPPFESKEYEVLLRFILTLLKRTEHAKESLNDTANSMAKLIAEKDPQMQGHKETLKDYRIELNNASELSVYHALINWPLLIDLNCKLIVNKTTTEFVTSDHPVVAYNQFMEKRKWPGGHTGIASKGLQMFLPISDRHLLIFFDPKIYKVGSAKATAKTVSLTYTPDVESINGLQLANANKKLFFKNVNETYIRELTHKFLRFKPSKKAVMKELEVRNSSGGETTSTIAHFQASNLLLNLELSTIKLHKNSRNVRLGPTMSNPRNETFLKAHQETIDLIEKSVDITKP